MVVRRENLTPGVPLDPFGSDIHLYTDSSNQGWRSTLTQQRTSGLWSQAESEFSINFWELLAVLMAVQTFRDHLWSLRVALFLRQHDSNILPEEGSGNSRGVRVPIDNVKATICSRVSGCGGVRLESGEPGSWIRMDTMSSGVSEVQRDG